MKSLLSAFIFTIAVSMYIMVPKGEIRCIYDEMGLGHKPSLYVNVVDGGKFDLHFSISSIAREETLVDIDIGTDPDHPCEYHNNDFEIPYFAEFKFCFDNSLKYLSIGDKIAEISFSGGDMQEGIHQSDNELLKDKDIENVDSVVKDIQKMTQEIKGKQAAYRLQEESRRKVVKTTHDRVSMANIVEIAVFFLFSIMQIFVVKRWFSAKKTVLG